MGTAGQSITLANSIIGVGILAMPFCFQKCGVLLATLILLSMGLISRLCCYFLLKSALLARRRNFEFLAFHVFGPAGKMAVEVGIIGFLMGTCIAYFVVVGDLGPQIIAKMFNINQSDILRTSIMVIVSLVCVLPLGLLRNVDSLSNVSAATIAFYFCLVIKVIAEAASQLVSGEWSERLDMWKPAGLLQCVPIFSMALFCQTQLFEIFESLPSLSLEKMNLVTKNAINICTGVYFTLGLFGYIAFCTQEISGNILMSLSPTMASDVIKLGFVMSLAFSFPLIIFPCRASLYSFLYKKVHSTHHDHIINHSIPERSFRCITVAIISVALFISLLIPNIELVLGLVGSTIGVLICVMFPAACFVNVTFKNTNERILAKAVLVLGLIIMVLGTYANLQAAETQMDKYDEKHITQERIDKIVEDFFEKRQKLEEMKVKSLPKSVPDSVDQVINNDIIKDSEVQPPNPVPPDVSNEKEQIAPVEKVKENHEDIIKPSVDKILDLHPKDVKTKMNEVIQNGHSNEVKEEEPKKIDEPKLPNEDKMHIIKQQELIDKIKQHGEEQQELIKEKKEILDEIIKTKKELQQNKEEIGSAEAKKVAVESIKQIANIAIQSIGGVTEKPEEPVKEDQKAERLGKLSNDAVLEIVKKAAETIEAIQEIQEKRNDPVDTPAKNRDNNEEPKINILQHIGNGQSDIKKEEPLHKNGIKDKSKVDVSPQGGVVVEQNVASHLESVNNLEIQRPKNIDTNAQIPLDTKRKPNEKIADVNEQANIEPVINGYVPQLDDQRKPEIVPDKIESQSNIIAQNGNVIEQAKAQSPLIQDSKMQNVNVQNMPTKNQQKDIVNKNIPQNPEELNQGVKAHSHSPDEPQSYKQGEDLQKILEGVPNIGIQNVPLPLAVNDIKIRQEAQNGNGVKKPDLDNDVPHSAGKMQVIPPKDHSRQKRDVVDCTKKASLRVEQKEICENIIDNPLKNSQEVLPKVDLNDALLKRPQIEPGLLHHMVRSLKMYNEMDKKR